MALGQGANASGNGSSAIGQGAMASGANGTALGSNATAGGANSVAIGAGSVTTDPNTVSFGSQGNERRLTNVAPGVSGTDAVNMNQLWGVQSSVNQVGRRAYSGVAAATALTMIPEVDPGKTIAVGIGSGSYQGYAATALGASIRFSNNLKAKIGVGISGQGATYGAGASYQW
ncbi:MULTISPECIES: YadA family autotransporter adhesin [Burkholderia]|nr:MULTISPECIES: YadA-like family protein [Burkholderia]